VKPHPAVLALAVAALLALPPAAGQVSVRASSLSSAAGADVRLDSPAMDWYAQALASGAAGFHLQGSAVHEEVDSAHYVQAGPAASAGTDATPATAARNRHDAVYTGLSAGNESSLFLLPRAGSSLRAMDADASVGVPVLACQPQTDFVPGARQLPCADTSGAVEVRLSPQGLRVEGSFDVYLWGWQGTVRTPEGTEPYWTGTQYGTPQTGLASTGPSERRLMLLQVTNGTLEAELPGSAPPRAFAASAELSAPAVDLAGSEFSSATDARLVATRDGGLLRLDVLSGTLVDASGRTVVAAPGGDGRRWSPWLAAGLAAPALLAALAAGDARSRVRRAAESLAIGNPMAAYRHARRAQHYPWARRKAQTLGVIALLRADEVDRARSALQEAGSMGAATHEFLSSVVLARQGHLEEARAALERSIAADPAYADEAQRLPVLRALVAPHDRKEDVT
jgi:hypothetical protein